MAINIASPSSCPISGRILYLLAAAMLVASQPCALNAGEDEALKTVGDILELPATRADFQATLAWQKLPEAGIT